jgi:hypothetical protein
VKRKVIELSATALFILSLFSLCGMEYKTLSSEIIGLSISATVFIASAVLINKHYIDGRWE